MECLTLLDYKLKRAADDFLFFKGRCAVSFILVTTSSNPGTVDIYDGINTSGELVMSVRLLNNTTVSIPLSKPLVFNRGLYIDCDANTTIVSVDIAAIPE